MTDGNLDRLDELAAAATGEPWDFADWLTAENHEYIAACDPATIRSLVAAVRERDELREALRPVAVMGMCSQTHHEHIAKAAAAALHHKDGAS